ncbi:hypothetical protein CK203_006753 [Vitis vinifera]|uniref:Uncharacterized protein n=1 Tax=Vitis vinifera TaxID=29760 RepID=A0A438KBV3_VITVI|nr:hypothetical protein CK203_006753 [Vitis vinifera]
MLTCHLVMKHPLKLREIGGCKFFVHRMSHLYPCAVDIHEPQSGWFKYVSNSSVWWLHLNWDRDRVFSVRFLSMLLSRTMVFYHRLALEFDIPKIIKICHTRTSRILNTLDMVIVRY